MCLDSESCRGKEGWRGFFSVVLRFDMSVKVQTMNWNVKWCVTTESGSFVSWMSVSVKFRFCHVCNLCNLVYIWLYWLSLPGHFRFTMLNKGKTFFCETLIGFVMSSTQTCNTTWKISSLLHKTKIFISFLDFWHILNLITVCWCNTD